MSTKFDGVKSDKHLLTMAAEMSETVSSFTNSAFTNIDNFRKFAKEGKLELSGNLPESTKRKFAQNGVITVGGFNTLIQNVRREYGSSEIATFSLDEYFPEMRENAQTILNAIYAPNTGKMSARPLGTPFPQKAKLSLSQNTYNPLYFGEMVSFGEEELLYLRDYGSQDISSRGIQQSLIYNELKLLVSLYQTKFDIIASAATVGTYDYITLSSQSQTNWHINSNNQQFVPIGAKWATATGPGGAYIMNPLANPLQDIWYAITSYPYWMQYYNAIRSTGKFIMNPDTAQWILTNPNTQSSAAFQVSLSRDFDRYDLEAYFACYFPSSNIEVIIDYTILMNDDLTTQYVYPTGYISVMFNAASHGGSIGEFVYTTNVQSKGWVDPEAGIYTFIADLTSPQSYGGAEGNPHINIGVGANMNARIPNPNLVLTMYVV